MDECISREKLIKKFVDIDNVVQTSFDIDDILEIINRLPAEDIPSARHGTWGKQMLFDDGTGGAKVGYTCPVCKQYVPCKGNFCVECGADMR